MTFRGLKDLDQGAYFQLDHQGEGKWLSVFGRYRGWTATWKEADEHASISRGAER